MKHRDKFFLVLLLLAYTATSWGQTPSGGIDLQNMRGFGELFNISQREEGHRFGMQFRSAGVDGSPWLFDQTYAARLVLRTGDTLAQEVQANLNLEENQVIVVLSEAEAGTVPIQGLSRIVFVDEAVDDIFVPLPDYLVKNDRDETYRLYELIHEGKLLLLKSRRRKLLRSNKTGAYSATDGINDKYVEEVDYYLCEEAKQCERIKMRGKDVIQVLESWQWSTERLTRADEKARSEEEVLGILNRLDTTN